MSSKRTLLIGFVVSVFLMTGGPGAAIGQGLQMPQQDWALRLYANAVAFAPTDPGLTIGDTFTIEAWILPEGRGQLGMVLGKEWNYNGNQTGWWRIRCWDHIVGFEQSSGSCSGGVYYYAPSPFSLYQWMHVAVTCDGNGAIRLYLNGVLAATGGGGGACFETPDQVPFQFGQTPNLWGFSGAICQVSLWNRALNSGEISSTASNYLTGGETGLIAYWPCDDGPGYIIRNLVQDNMSFVLPPNDTDIGGVPVWARTAVLNSGPYLLAKESISWPPNGLGSIAALIDFDSDGRLDIVSSFYGSYPSGFRAFRNDGTNHFVDVTQNALEAHHAPDGNWPTHWVVDINGDGLRDLLVSDMSIHGFIAFIKTIDGRLVDETDTRIPQGTPGGLNASVGDIDGDGDIDVFTGYSFLINDGQGYFAGSTDGLPDDIRYQQRWIASTTLVDVNGDCALDMILGDAGLATGRNATLLFNNGHGVFDYASESSMPPGGVENWITTKIESADISADGYQDLILVTSWQNYTNTRVLLYLNNGDGTFRDASNVFPTDLPTFIWIIPGDFNGDGRVDLYLGGLFTSGLYLNTNDPNHLFINSTDLICTNPNALTFGLKYYSGFGGFVGASSGDLEGDGDLDIVFAPFGPGTQVPLINYKSWPMPNPLPFPLESDLISPQNASDHQALPTLHWTEVVTAGFYQLQVATDQYFNNIVFDRNGLTCSSHQPATLTKGKDYYWRVRAINTRGAGPWSEVWSFYYGDIIPYAFEGFFSPIENLPVVNQAKAGQAVPVKWRITDRDGLPISDPASFINITSYNVNCASFEGDPTNYVEEVAAGSSGLQYLGNGWWQFNWKTSKAYKGQCRVMKLTLDDKSEHTASFSFK